MHYRDQTITNRLPRLVGGRMVPTRFNQQNELLNRSKIPFLIFIEALRTSLSSFCLTAVTIALPQSLYTDLLIKKSV